MKKLVLLLGVLMILALFNTSVSFAEVQSIKEALNDDVMNSNTENHTQLVPMRDILERMGGTVTWHSEDQSVSAIIDDISIWVQPGNLLAEVNNEQITLPEAPKIVNGTMLVPIEVFNIITKVPSEKLDNKENAITTNIVSKMIWPIPGYTKISQGFGDISGISKLIGRKIISTGISIPAPEGTPIVAAADGKVIFAGELGGFGNMILIDHGSGIVTLYGQCSELFVKVDSQVKAGDVIAKSGDTGNATGPCLYFEVREKGEPVDPNKYLAK
ncbi:murein DD-endopeptidase MepM/ murein hydrolase activator NlpD [Anaerosolibacter carboniphilus]|uniref:Murein DD-endopeptidase MepM/ murein hydrolase activator NlpD n=1 Tax=Anaerosolibacter carboniphilus TaxID=1417629 RepID=A0A841KZU4_9FIRM|nr:peptidoglycan DD-metalloendopeptidase family protein [Anaerosolibacter carboniphilus]MBB6218887.1 murein DD-endopeptidase MepM/ murein hydrolase activator NlpD [Anaerosolibacter carboniphilus]